MTRHPRISKASAVFAVTAFTLPCLALADAGRIRPNIVFVFADQLRSHALGCYGNDQVKAVCISSKTGEPCVTPTLETARTREYPLSRPLFMYTLGEAEGAIAQYLEWIRSPEGQRIVAETGFVPLS